MAVEKTKKQQLEGQKIVRQIQKKARNKKKGRKGDPIARVRRGEPVYLYLCECHGKPAKKPPVERTPEDRANRKYSETTLGKWRCSVSGQKCKVKRTRNKIEDVQLVSDARP